jgi:hypothetical protein
MILLLARMKQTLCPKYLGGDSDFVAAFPTPTPVRSHQSMMLQPSTEWHNHT